MINLNYLRYFYVCAQSGTFTKAAEKLRVSQPSLSIQIKNFEEQLGFQLFIRSGRTVQLTAKGQGLFGHASKIFQLSDEMEKFLKSSEQTIGGRLNIGVSDEVERPFVADIVGRLIKSGTGQSVLPSILSRKHPEMIALLANQEIDLLITNEKNSEFKMINRTSIPVMLISANRVARSKVQSSLSQLMKIIDQPLIMPVAEMILAAQTKKFLKNNQVETRSFVTSNILACITRLVQEKLGAAFLPTAYVQRELRLQSLFAYGPKEGFWLHDLYLYGNKNNANQFENGLAKIMQDFSVLNFDSFYS